MILLPNPAKPNIFMIPFGDSVQYPLEGYRPYGGKSNLATHEGCQQHRPSNLDVAHIGSEHISQKGFSLMEIMIALAILSILLTGVISMFSTSSKYHGAQDARTTVNQNLRAIKQMMVQDIRKSGLNQSESPTLGVGFQGGGDDRYDTDANSIHFISDLNGDGDVLDTNDNVGYYRQTAAGVLLNPGDNTQGVLIRRYGNPSTPRTVTDGITNLSFTYFDAGNNNLGAAPVLANIRSVEVIISSAIDSGRLTTADKTLQFRIKIRNVGL